METNHRVTYQPRKGTTNSGWNYEANMLTLLALRCVRQNFKDFWLGTNVADVGDFDDVILHIQESPKSNGFTFFIQLKHSEGTKTINEKDFMSVQKGNKDFSLVKYSENFTKLKATLKSKSSDLIVNKIEPTSTTFVLFTNRTSVKHKFLENDSNNWFFLLNTHSSTKNIYRFNLTKLDRSKLNNLDYCENIRLFSNQGDVNKLNNLIKGEVEKLTERIGVENVDVQAISDKFKDYINDWARGNLGKCFYLTKYDIEFKLGQLFLLQFVVNLNKECLHCFNEAKIWNDIIQDKKITVVDSDDHVVPFLKQCVGTDLKHYFDGTGKSWSYVLSNEQKKLLYKNTNLEVQMRDVIGNREEITILDIYTCLAFHGELPILLEMNSIQEYNDILNIMKFSNYNFRALIINNTSELVPDTSVKHFLTLCDLDTEERDKILDLRVKLQGRSSSVLRDLIDDTMYKFIKCSDVIYILLNIFNVGNTLTEYSNISECFIHRSLSKVMFKHEVIEKVENELFLVEHPDNPSRPSTSHNRNSENDTRNLSNDRNLLNVINCKQNETAQEFEKLKGRGEVIHRLKSHDDYYEWKETFGSVKNIRQHQLIQHNTFYKIDRNVQASPLDVTTFWIQVEDELKLGKGSDLPNKTYIIDGSPGMGKTTILDFIAQHAPPNIWIFKINLSEHDEYFEEIKRTNAKLKTVDYIQYFKKTILQNCPNGNLAEMVADKLLDERRVLYLMDGFDEIAISYKNEVTNILKLLQGDGYPMWVTNRSITKEHLEKELNTISVTLKPFVKNDQTTFLIKYFTQVCINIGNTTSDSTSTESLIEEFTNELLEAKDLSLIDKYSEFLGIPLQIKLLGEVFSDDCKNYLQDPKEIVFNHSIDLLHLYTKFIEKKSDIFFKKNKKSTLLRDLMRHIFENHQHLFALKSLFSKEDLIELNIDKELEDYNEDKQMKLQFLLVEGVIEKTGSKSNSKLNIRFVHRTFAEYFAAQWLYLSINSNNEKVKDTAIKLMRERFQRYPDYLLLFNIFDRLAAKNNPLHLAIIDGKASEANNMIISNPENANTVDECNRSIIHMAALYGTNASIWNLFPDLWHMKDLVGYNPLYYALISARLGIANKICEKSKDLTLHNFIDVPNKQLFLAFSMSQNYIHLHELVFSHFLLRDILLKNVDKTCSFDSYHRYLCKTNILGVLHSLPTLKFNLKTISELSIFNPPNQYYTNLHLASVFGSKENVQDLLEEGCIVNQHDIYSNNTSLHYAIIHDRLEIVELLLSNAADVNKLGYDDNTSLHFAVKTGNISLVKTLSEQTRSQINKRNSDNDTPLHIAIINNYTEIAEFLLSEGANCNIEIDEDRNSWLHYACKLGNADIVSLLLNKGGKVNSINSSRRTPLHFAVQYSKINLVSIVKLLIYHNADLNIQDIKGYSPLHYAAEKGHTKENHHEIIPLLLSKNADVDKQDNAGNTPIHLALKGGSKKIAEVLLKQCENINAKNSYGSSLLHFAVLMYRNKEIVLEILTKGGDINITNNMGMTPLHFLLFKLKDYYLDTMKLLLSKGADCNIVDAFGKLSPLHWAVQYGKIVSVICQVDPTIADVRYDLHPFRVGSEDSFEIQKLFVDLLLKSGANCNLTDTDGNTPLHLANTDAHFTWLLKLEPPGKSKYLKEIEDNKKLLLLNFREYVVNLLINSGADVNIRNNEGKTAMDLANEKGFAESVSLLQSKC